MHQTMHRIIGGLTAALVATAAAAAPRVATDVPPVHSLVAMVMAGRGAPELIVPPGASPHGFALRPSQAAALAQADAVIWVGAALTPWFAEAVEGLAGRAISVELGEVPGTVLLPIRADARFAPHDGHAHGEVVGDGHGEDHADGHGEDHADGHGDGRTHADDHADADGHGHDGDAMAGMDEHVWLDPSNARLWLPAIAEALAEADPDGAARYRANAAAAARRIEALEAEIDAMLSPVRGRPYVVFHDAYQYFGARFDLPAAGAISLGDASRPGAGRVAEVRALLAAFDAACVFAEPQFAPRILAAVTEGTGARLATLDPLGATLAPGADLYPALMLGLATSLRDCLDR